MGYTDLSYIAYADDIFLISRCKSSQSRTVKTAEKGFLDIGLKNTSIPSVENFQWLG